MKRKTPKLVIALLLGSTIAAAQQRQIWEDETKTIFRGSSLELGTSEQDFAQRYPGGFKTSVETDLREPGSLPTVYVNGEWKLLDPKLTTKEQFLPRNGDTREVGVFYFQAGKLVALEISRNDSSNDGDSTPQIFTVLRSLSAQGRSCSINGFKSTDSQQFQMVRVTCGRHYLTMRRELFANGDSPFIAYGFFEGLIYERAKLVELPKSQN